MRIATIIILLGVAVGLLGQDFDFLGTNYSSPQGSFPFFEYFGNWMNPSVPCWASGPSGCRQNWTVGAGTANSIATSPVAIKPGWGKNSLKMTIPGGGTANIYTYGTFAYVPPATTADYYISVYIVSSSVANFHLENFFCASQDTGCGTFVAKVSWTAGSGNLQIQGIGGGGSSSAVSGTVSVGAAHIVRLHLDATAASCNTYLDGVATGTFTCAANTVKYLVLGDSGGNHDAITYYVGQITSLPYTLGGGFPPSAFLDFEGGSNGVNPTTTTLAASTHGGPGGAAAWSISGGTTAFTYSTGAQMALHSPVTVYGTQYTGAGSLGLFYDPSQTAEALLLNFLTPTSSCSASFMFKYTVTDTTDAFTLGNITNSGGTGFGFHFLNGTIYLSNQSDNIPISSGTWYWLSYLLQAGGPYYLSVYETTNWTLVATKSRTTSENTGCVYMCLGRACGADTAFSGTGGFYYDSMILDYNQGRWPWQP